jgi:16S rRNA (adenine1518-N6/adenine1519-N6)-dimethyltransferase
VNIKAKKSLGQNFLIDKNIIDKITSISNVQGKEVLEVGPGSGNLTEQILRNKPKKFYVIEKDKDLCSILDNRFENQISIINDDVLKINENLISKEKLIVFGNLPYNISTEIICNWILKLKKDVWFYELILMFQKEVADRIISKNDMSTFGRLSILSQWRLNIKKIIDIKSNCFNPKPKVDSTLLYFSPKQKFQNLHSPKNLELVTRIFFNQRRKMIKNPFKQLFKNYKKISENLNIDLNLRPQNLSTDTYLKIAQEYEKSQS